MKRAEETLRWWGLDPTIDIKSIKHFTQPPWKLKTLVLRTELNEPIQKENSQEEVRALAIETIQTRYNNHLHMYTDGSKTEESTSAAIYIPSIPHEESWKLEYGTTRSIMMAELYAIMKCLMWLAMHHILINLTEIVILTDSKSGIEAIRNPNPGKQSTLLNTIRNLSETLLENGISITIKWLPAHVGIEGNEKADNLAKAANHKQNLTPYPLERYEIKRLVNTAMRESWQRQYDTIKQNLHIGPIKPKIGKWAWAHYGIRNQETIITRLRIGHVELNEYLHRFNQHDSPNCPHCNTPETTSHFLLDCTKYTTQRTRLKLKLRSEEITTFDTNTLLGGGNLTLHKQKEIVKALAFFIKETERFNSVQR